MGPVPQPSAYSISLYNKPTPPTPPPTQDEIPQSGRGRDRAGSLPTHIPNERRPSTAEEKPSRPRLSVLPEFRDSDGVYHISHGDVSGSIDLSALKRTRSQKWKQVMGVDDALNDVPVRPALPWYLQPKLAGDLALGPDGTIVWGTLEALIEKLTCDVPIRDPASTPFTRSLLPFTLLMILGLGMLEDNNFRNAFLMTFRTFMKADVLFDMLVDRYRMDHPENLSNNEFENWRKHNIASQRRVLMIFTMWLESHRLLEEEPHIAQRLTDFLKLITTAPLATEAKRLLDAIERLVRVRAWSLYLWY